MTRKHVPDWHPVQPDPPVTIVCANCGKRFEAGTWKTGDVWADLNGLPFRAYACPDCKADYDAD